MKDRILLLQDQPLPHDSKQLIGYEHYNRVDIGEYRIIYRYENKKEIITVVLVGRGNDNSIYRIAKRVLK